MPIPTKPPVYNEMIAPRDSWMMPPPCNEMIPPGGLPSCWLKFKSAYQAPRKPAAQHGAKVVIEID